MDNSNLKTGAKNSIDTHIAEIRDAHLDKGGLVGEVKQKLSHDAAMTMGNSFAQNAGELIGLSKPAKTKSNFNNEGEDK